MLVEASVSHEPPSAQSRMVLDRSTVALAKVSLCPHEGAGLQFEPRTPPPPHPPQKSGSREYTRPCVLQSMGDSSRPRYSRSFLREPEMPRLSGERARGSSLGPERSHWGSSRFAQGFGFRFVGTVRLPLHLSHVSNPLTLSVSPLLPFPHPRRPLPPLGTPAVQIAPARGLPGISSPPKPQARNVERMPGTVHTMTRESSLKGPAYLSYNVTFFCTASRTAAWAAISPCKKYVSRTPEGLAVMGVPRRG